VDYYFIVNPVSGRGRGKIFGEKLKERLKNTSLDYQIVFSDSPGDAVKLAERAAAKFKTIVAVGGDGTMNEIVNGIAGSDAVLGLIPVGSGNDFVKAVNIPIDFDEAFEVLMRGKKRKIDLGKANDRYYHNGLGIGFDAWVVNTSLKVKRLRGNAIYLYSVLRTLMSYTPVPLELYFNGSLHADDFFMITVGNGVSLGGGFYLTPDAEIDDGLFDLCLIQNMPVVSILKNLLKVYSGTHKDDPRVEIVRTDHLEIEAKQPFAAHVDGELLALDLKKLTVELIPRGLELIC